MLNEIIKYAQGVNVKQDVFDWIYTHLNAQIKKQKPEHKTFGVIAT